MAYSLFAFIRLQIDSRRRATE